MLATWSHDCVNKMKGTVVETWEKEPPPDRNEIVERLLRGLCEALAYVHDAGFIQQHAGDHAAGADLVRTADTLRVRQRPHRQPGRYVEEFAAAADWPLFLEICIDKGNRLLVLAEGLLKILFLIAKLAQWL